jgi:hypothetical protein
MFTRILTDLERKRIKSYLKQDGEKDVNIRQLVMRYKRDLPTIQSDMDLLERLLATYSRKAPIGPRKI